MSEPSSSHSAQQSDADEPSTSEVGNAFRDAVCDLLRTKYPDLRVERRVAGTKVDIRFTSDGLAREVWAVECKDYAKPLDKGYVSRDIYSLYRPMLDTGDVDRVLIVSRNGLTTDAQDYVDSVRGFSHKTYVQLAEDMVGLRRYIQHLASLRPTDDAEYIEARLEGEPASALKIVQDWVREGPGPGLAILGSYGQGKTSFAKRLVAHYATRHLQDSTERMPIFLRLGEVVHETQLEGLFGKEFTARHPCLGYQFSTLEHLNRCGRLLVVLDGFDEMKHAMTAADFLTTFPSSTGCSKAMPKSSCSAARPPCPMTLASRSFAATRGLPTRSSRAPRSSVGMSARWRCSTSRRRAVC